MHLRSVFPIDHPSDGATLADIPVDSSHTAHSVNSAHSTAVDARIPIVVQFRALHAHQVPAGYLQRTQSLGLGPGARMGPEAAALDLVRLLQPSVKEWFLGERYDQSSRVAVGSFDEESNGVGRGGSFR